MATRRHPTLAVVGLLTALASPLAKGDTFAEIQRTRWRRIRPV